MQNMYGAALLKAIDESGVAILTLTEGLQDDELLASRLTRAEVARHLRLLVDATQALPESMRAGMPEVGWAELQATGSALSGPPGLALDDALLVGSKILVPAALMWLRVYRQQHPEWFSMSLA